MLNVYNNMNIFDKDVKQISGPINVVRMEGNTNGIHKVLYLFMDYHENINLQTECANVFSKDLNKYLAEKFYNLNGMRTMYDFFMEIRPTDIVPIDDTDMKYLTHRKKYLSQVIKFFSSAFVYDKKKDLVKISDIFRNVRLHYLDVRDYFKYHIMDLLDPVLYISNKFIQRMYIEPDRLQLMIETLIKTRERVDIVIAILNSSPQELRYEKNPLIKRYKEFDLLIVERVVKKIRQSYNHSNVQKILVEYFDKYVQALKKISDEIEKSINVFTGYSEYLKNNYGKLIRDQYNRYSYGVNPMVQREIIVNIVDECEMLYGNLIKAFSRITDIYFLRRFIDKDYITNAIVYSGVAHSETYIKILVTEFDFKITHCAYSQISDLEFLNKEIKRKTIDDEDIRFLINPPYLYQCSDITNFPENFL
jgi:hypothetical protein